MLKEIQTGKFLFRFINSCIYLNIDKEVTLKPRTDENENQAMNENQSEQKNEGSLSSKVIKPLGMQVTNIDNTIKDKYDVKNGILVTSVDNFSEAFMRGIRENYVITEADKKKISNVDDLAEIVNGKKEGDSILMRIVTPDKQERIVAVEIQ